jgi:hypothetical protein
LSGPAMTYFVKPGHDVLCVPRFNDSGSIDG